MRDWFLIRFHLELVNHLSRQFVPSLQPSSPPLSLLTASLSLSLLPTVSQYSVLTIRYLVVSNIECCQFAVAYLQHRTAIAESAGQNLEAVEL